MNWSIKKKIILLNYSFLEYVISLTQFNLQNLSATYIMQGIIDLHHHILFFLIMVSIFVFWVFFKTFRISFWSFNINSLIWLLDKNLNCCHYWGNWNHSKKLIDMVNLKKKYFFYFKVLKLFYCNFLIKIGYFVNWFRKHIYKYGMIHAMLLIVTLSSIIGAYYMHTVCIDAVYAESDWDGTSHFIPREVFNQPLPSKSYSELPSLWDKALGKAFWTDFSNNFGSEVLGRDANAVGSKVDGAGFLLTLLTQVVHDPKIFCEHFYVLGTYWGIKFSELTSEDWKMLYDILSEGPLRGNYPKEDVNIRLSACVKHLLLEYNPSKIKEGDKLFLMALISKAMSSELAINIKSWDNSGWLAFNKYWAFYIMVECKVEPDMVLNEIISNNLTFSSDNQANFVKFVHSLRLK